MDIICDELNKTKSKLHDQWIVEEAMIKKKKAIKEQKKVEKAKERDTFIKCFNATYPHMRARKPWFGFDRYESLDVIIGRRESYKVAEVRLHYDDGGYGLSTEICNYQSFGSLEKLVASQKFTDCLKPNAYPYTIPFD